MAKKKREKAEKEAVASAASSDSPAAGEGTAEFPSARRIAIISTCAALFLVLVLVLASFNGLQFAKRALLVVAGVEFPSLVAQPYTSWDAGLWLCLATAVVWGALIHPALGIGALLMFRPWIDGYTFMGDNSYFLWATLFITVVWGARQLMQGHAWRAKAATAFLGGFLVAGLIATLAARSYGESVRELLHWAAYFCLFLVSANALRSEKSIRIVLWSFVLVLAGEAIYAVLQYQYMLPYLREMLANSPEERMRYFGTTDFSPELIHRFNMNRAFGSTLFPNALAGFLLIGIPLSAVLGLDAWRRFGPLRKATPEPVADWSARRYRAIAWGGLAWICVTVFFYCIFLFPTMYFMPPLPWYSEPITLFLAAGGLALIPGLAIGAAYDKRGGTTTWLGMAAFLMPALLLVQLLALWLSYSRGGMLSLQVATVAAVVLYRFGGDGTGTTLGRLPRWLVPACSLLLAGAMAVAATGQSSAVAQEAVVEEAATPAAPAAPQSTGGESSQALRQEGFAVSLGDLANPATFKIRLVYWRVGWEMFKSSPLTGVGLANFATAYANFQDVGDDSVRNAHNGYLQAFCETGVLGGVLLTAFWAWFVVWGGLRVLREGDRARRLLLAGVFAAVFGFAGHAFIDIHFGHPGMMMFVMPLAGLFYALAARDSGKTGAPKLGWQVAVMPVLLIAAVVFGLSVRMYMRDAALSRASLVDIASQSQVSLRQDMLSFFLQPAKEYVYVNSALQFIPDLTLLDGLGSLVKVLPNDSGMRELRQGEELPPDAVLRVARAEQSRLLGLEWGELWAADFAGADGWFPHEPAVAAIMSNWYATLSQRSEGEARRKYAVAMLDWAQRAIERNPSVPQHYEFEGEALWRLGQIEGGTKGEARYQAAIASYKKARNRVRSLPKYHDLLARQAGILRDAYRDAATQAQDDPAARKKYQEKHLAFNGIAMKAAAEAARIRAARAEMGLHPEGN